MTVDDYKKMLERGRHCVEHDYDNEALRIFTEVYDRFADPQTDEDKALYLEAVAGIMDLRQTDNEYIWERTGWYVQDYFDWLDGRKD